MGPRRDHRLRTYRRLQPTKLGLRQLQSLLVHVLMSRPTVKPRPSGSSSLIPAGAALEHARSIGSMPLSSLMLINLRGSQSGAAAWMRERTATLKAQRERAKAALDHARAQCGMAAAINAEKIDAFMRLMNAKLKAGDTNACKGYINSIIDGVEVDDQAIRIIGSKDILRAAIAGKQTENGNVRGLVRKWRARNDSNVRPSDS